MREVSLPLFYMTKLKLPWVTELKRENLSSVWLKALFFFTTSYYLAHQTQSCEYVYKKMPLSTPSSEINKVVVQPTSLADALGYTDQGSNAAHHSMTYLSFPYCLPIYKMFIIVQRSE